MNVELVTELRAQVEDLTARVETLTREIADLGAAVSAGPRVVSPGFEDLAYSSLESWVTEFFTPTFRRTFGGEFRWCPRWQDHPEAVLRLDALWRAHESLRSDGPLGMATWFTHFLDPQLAVLLGRGGPFGQCGTDRHTSGSPATQRWS